MKTLSSIAVAGLLCWSAQGASFVDSFESGLGAWSTLGATPLVNNYGSHNPTHGDAFLMLTTSVGAVTDAAFFAAGGTSSHGVTSGMGSLVNIPLTLASDAILSFDVLRLPGSDWSGHFSATPVTPIPVAYGGERMGFAYFSDDPDGWVSQTIALAAGDWTLSFSLLGQDGAAIGLDNIQLLNPVGWYDYGPDGYLSANPFPGERELPIAESVPEPSAALVPLLAGLVGLAHSRKMRTRLLS